MPAWHFGHKLKCWQEVEDRGVVEEIKISHGRLGRPGLLAPNFKASQAILGRKDYNWGGITERFKL